MKQPTESIADSTCQACAFDELLTAGQRDDLDSMVIHLVMGGITEDQFETDFSEFNTCGAPRRFKLCTSNQGRYMPKI